jgi:hypothetical protein
MNQALELSAMPGGREEHTGDESYSSYTALPEAELPKNQENQVSEAH